MKKGAAPDANRELGEPVFQESLATHLVTARKELEVGLLARESATGLSRRYAQRLDALLRGLCAAALSEPSTPTAASEADPAPTLEPWPVAIAAVGGYGRGLVALHSDIDILFVCGDAEEARVHRIAERILYPLWDSGLAIGHAVRTVDETLALAATDLATATTMLDLRWVAGDPSLLETLDARAHALLFGDRLPEFLDALRKDMVRRHQRSGDSPFLLEPDLKLGRGGLRDLDVANWVLRARWNASTLPEQVASFALSASEGSELQDATELLWRVRNLLHWRAQRKHDRLTFSDQEDIAEQLGFEDGMILAVEQFMQGYYRQARVVARMADRLLERARPVRPSGAPERALEGPAITLRDGAVALDGDAATEAPWLVLRALFWAFEVAAPLHCDTRDVIFRLVEDAHFGEALRADPKAAALFLKLLGDPGHSAGAPHATSCVREIHELGILLAMIPEFGPLTARAQHDAYHLYTVDVHAVRAVSFLGSLQQRAVGVPLQFAEEIAAKLGSSPVLTLAALLHGLGKAYGMPAREHASDQHRRRGARLAQRIAERLGVSPENAARVSWLVAHQLVLYQWATRRDTTDQEALEELVAIVEDHGRLDELLVLTAAVLATTNPREMTAWKSRLLEDVYQATSAALSARAGEPPAPRVDAARAAAERTGLALLASDRPAAVDDGDRVVALQAFLATMPDRYLVSNAAEQIGRHAALQSGRRGEPFLLELLPGFADGVAEVALFAEDRPGLLADVTAVFAAHGLEVVQAQIYTRQPENAPAEAVDLFHVRKRAVGEDPRDMRALHAMRSDLSALFAGALTAHDLLSRAVPGPQWAQRTVPTVATEVVIHNDVTKAFTIVEIFTQDRPGLLHAIASALTGLNLSVALSKITTEGARAADAFYVSRIEDPEQLAAVAGQLEHAIEAFHRVRTEAVR